MSLWQLGLGLAIGWLLGWLLARPEILRAAWARTRGKWRGWLRYPIAVVLSSLSFVLTAFLLGFTPPPGAGFGLSLLWLSMAWPFAVLDGLRDRRR